MSVANQVVSKPDPRLKGRLCRRCGELLNLADQCNDCMTGTTRSSRFAEFVDRVMMKCFGLPVGLILADKNMRSIMLYMTDAGKNMDKVYELNIVSHDSVNRLYNVDYAYGKRGHSLRTGRKTGQPSSIAECNRIFDVLVAEKKARGYTQNANGIA